MGGKKVAGGILIGIGISVMVIGALIGGTQLFVTIIAGNQQNLMMANAKELGMLEGTDGTVMEADQENKSTTVSYYDQDGNYQESEWPIYSSDYEVGKEVTVYYMEQVPDAGFVPELMELVWRQGIKLLIIQSAIVLSILLFIGTAMIVGGCLLMKKPKPKPMYPN
ncbi:MAG: hypothetical protein J1E61_10495 [Lachnospiraceae bacterium]|nr:hypothetical protein [Lachnospiraceae bacterium]